VGEVVLNTGMAGYVEALNPVFGICPGHQVLALAAGGTPNTVSTIRRVSEMNIRRG